MQKKILVLVANPRGTSNLNLLPEIRDLEEALQRSQQGDRFSVVWKVAKTQADLRRYILDVRPQMIHFCGHGTTQGLVLEDEAGKVQVVTNEFLTDLLAKFADRIECVLLNACYSESLANQLVQHLNYVIGMNRAVLDAAAIAFTNGFYDALGAGEDYDRAFEIGRNAVLGMAAHSSSSRDITVAGEGESNGQHREHLIPVLRIKEPLTPMQSLWLSPDVEREAIGQLLGAIEQGFNTIRLFHSDQPIVLTKQYIPVQVTLERRYQHTVETIGGYAESEAELRRIYALKGGGEEEIKRQQVDWLEARRQQSRIVVLADPGMGKSTLLRMEVGRTIQQADQGLAAGRSLSDLVIPVFLRLSTLADEVVNLSVDEAILKIVQEQYPTVLRHGESEVMAFLNEFLKKQLLNGKVLLLLDALDEVPDGKRQKLLDKLNGFAQHSTCAIVATSRIVGYGGRLVDGAKDMEIVPFTQEQTEQYIEQWFENAKESLTDQSVSARGLIQALRERPQIGGLAQNPLLLSLICSLYQRDRLTLPARRSQIYEQAVECMLSEWGQTRSSYDASRTTAKMRLLEALAYHFTCEGREVFEYEDLYDWVEEYLENDAPRDLRDCQDGGVDCGVV
ncbi:MAG: NACHT domain-containing protein [Leptolyngbyaceae cyanobacterium SL_7_1]|nr:NACHT domain-containing protein [Leptolyngbyaceae cyanobacterium SL_7_1]